MTEPTTLVLVRDLIFASRIRAAAQALNAPIQLIREPQQLTDLGGDRLIVDLNQPGALEAAVQWKARSGGTIIGFVSHVDRPTIDRARSQGVDQVLPRGRFVEQLDELLKQEK
jgi:hypothetical protein